MEQEIESFALGNVIMVLYQCKSIQVILELFVPLNKKIKREAIYFYIKKTLIIKKNTESGLKQDKMELNKGNHV